MKKILFSVIVLLSITSVLAQTPNQFKYQAVLRNADGTLIANQNIGVYIEILEGSTEGTSVFNETHIVTTTAQGLINLNIGSINDMSGIDWASDLYFIRITVNGTIMGVSQLLSVPYAMHAKTAENVSNFLLTGNEPAFEGWDKNQNDDFDGQYESLVGAPTALSEFTNDAGYITGSSVWGNGECNSSNYYLQPISPMKTFRGRLTNSNGDPISGIITANFKLYDQAEGGSAIWSETVDIAFDNGFFVCELGQVSPIDDIFISIPKVFLEIGFGGEVLQPRIKMTGTGYAVKAKVADAVDWTDVTDHPTNLSQFANDEGFLTTVDGSETVVTAGTNVTVSGVGTSADPYVINSSAGSSNISLGSDYAGGKVVYIDETGEHGLCISLQPGSFTYSTNNALSNITDSNGIGGGYNNSISWLIKQPVGLTSYAFNYEVEQNGVTYGEWYLPSLYELNLIYENKTLLGISDAIYFSSSVKSSDEFYGIDFATGETKILSGIPSGRLCFMRKF